jgi:hypothetical protein
MGKVNWNKRLSWGSPSPRTTSRFFSNAEVKKFGRVFYDAFFFDGKRVALHDCIGVALDKNDRTVRLRQHAAAHALSLTLPAQGDETSRVLELWEDTKGSEKGHKCFRGRWLFYPRHLREDHPDATRKRTGLASRQVYEQCDAKANDEENYLASMRSVQRVLCRWEDSRNRLPSDEELQAAHAWFDSGWDDASGEVVPLSECVDKPGSGALRAAAARHDASDAPPSQLASHSSAPSKSCSRPYCLRLLARPGAEHVAQSQLRRPSSSKR